MASLWYLANFILHYYFLFLERIKCDQKLLHICLLYFPWLIILSCLTAIRIPLLCAIFTLCLPIGIKSVVPIKFCLYLFNNGYSVLPIMSVESVFFYLFWLYIRNQWHFSCIYFIQRIVWFASQNHSVACLCDIRTIITLLTYFWPFL